MVAVAVIVIITVEYMVWAGGQVPEAEPKVVDARKEVGETIGKLEL